ncbi:serine/threonine-protein kinase [Nocardia sp. NPDC055321]
MTDEKLLPGTIFAGYRIVRVLGRGGMGTVYLGRHPRLPRFDALKVLPGELAEDPQFRARFVREAEVAARVEHPNIVEVWDRGIESGRLWIAMRFVDGTDASELLRRRGSGALGSDEAMHVVSEAARGLDAAHRAGLLHRDVKPANILLESRPGAPDRVYVSDFGIARSATQATMLTRPGAVVATLAYAAPEVFESAPVDHRVDVYALGCVLYELLTGAKPFERADEMRLMVAHLQDPPPSATAADPSLPAAIDAVIARALAKNPAARYGSCGELADAARAALHGEPPVPEQPPAARRRLGVTLGVGVTVLAVAVLAVVGVRVRGADEPQPAAAAPTTTAPVLTWGQYDFLVRAFPDLLPKTPLSVGFESMRCTTFPDEPSVSDTTPLPAMADLDCRGTANPVAHLFVICNTDRTPLATQLPDGVRPAVESWERASGRGRVYWWDSTDNLGNPQGHLSIQFDDAARNFCGIGVTGTVTGREMFERWFPGMPI